MNHWHLWMSRHCTIGMIHNVANCYPRTISGYLTNSYCHYVLRRHNMRRHNPFRIVTFLWILLPNGWDRQTAGSVSVSDWQQQHAARCSPVDISSNVNVIRNISLIIAYSHKPSYPYSKRIHVLYRKLRRGRVSVRKEGMNSVRKVPMLWCSHDQNRRRSTGVRPYPLVAAVWH